MSDYTRSGPFTNGQLPAVNDDALNNMDEGIDLAHEEIEALDTRLDTAETNITSLDSRVDTLESGGSDTVPTGAVIDFAGAAAPSGWLLCDGSAVSRATYADLFAVIASTYGGGDGSTTFNVPNFKGKVAVMLDAAQTEFDALGESGGANTHTLTEAELPAHDHPVTDPGHTHSYTAPAGTNTPPSGGGAPNTTTGGTTGSATTGITVGNAGSGDDHNNLQPYLVVNKIIKT